MSTDPRMDRSLRQLGRYELRTRIAVGGMGEIFLATMRGTAGFEKRVIIKTILPHLAEEREFVEKFLDEGRIVVQLTHGNIVPVFDMDEVDGEYYIAMEYIPGRDLRETIKRALARGEPVPAELALHVVSELCKGLQYAHSKRDESGESLRIVHRDVSPSNVLLSTDGEVKIIDFGIARATSRVGRTVSGRIQGKFCYMSPEQASGKPLDQRSDVFSAGVVLYELLTGMRPFQGDSDMHSLELVRACEFDPPSALNPMLPEEIDAVVLRALARDPAERYESAEAMHLALMHLMFEQGMVVTSSALRDFLSELFPEGVERAELKLPGASGSAPAKKLSLDDALGLELDRLSSGELGTPTGVGTARTATHLSDVEALGQTVTLDSGRSAPQPERVRVDSASATQQEQRGETPARAAFTPTLIERSGQRAQDETPSPAVPVAPGVPVALAEAEDAPLVERAPDDPLTPVTSTGSTTSTGELSAPLSLFEVKGFKRTMGFGLIAIPVLIAAGFLLADVFEEQRAGQVVFKTQPPGARVYLNHALLPNVRTPEPVTLAAGEDHPITLRLDGYEPIELLATGVRTRKIRVYDGADMVFKKIPSGEPVKPPEPKAREVTITLDPADGALTADNKPVKGPPFVVALGADAINLVASHPRCDSRPYTLPSSFKADAMKLALLNCQAAAPEPDMGAPVKPARVVSPRPARRPERVKLTLKASVPDAKITARGAGVEAQGTGSLTVEALAERKLVVTASHPEHKPLKLTIADPARAKNPTTLKLEALPMGCVQVSTALIAALTVHSKTHQVKHGSRLTLPAGEHAFSARQPALKKDMQGSVTVKPGDACAVVKLFF